jgi:hypothetical protein
VASALAAEGGSEAARLRVAENWVNNFGELARTTNSMIVPASVSDMSAMLATAFGVFEQSKQKQ